MKKRVLFKISVAAGLIVSVLLLNFSAFAADCKEIRENTLRLHVIANSDSESDQQLKLLVRDRILEETSDIFSSSQSSAESVEWAKDNLDYIISVAQDEVKRQGYDYEVSAEVCEMFFKTIEYGDVTMPAGRYNALRIKIGSFEGKNWWCVLFPPLCLPECTVDSEKTEILEPVSGENADFQVKFYFVEVIERIKEWLK